MNAASCPVSHILISRVTYETVSFDVATITEICRIWSLSKGVPQHGGVLTIVVSTVNYKGKYSATNSLMSNKETWNPYGKSNQEPQS